MNKKPQACGDSCKDDLFSGLFHLMDQIEEEDARNKSQEQGETAPKETDSEGKKD